MFGKRANAPEQLRSLPDEVLCREATGGNHDAFLVLFDGYCEDVFRLAYSVLRNKAEAEDLVQGLFLEVHTTMLRYDEERGSFRTLLLRYAYTRAIDHRRHLESRRYYTSAQIEELQSELLVQDDSLASGLYLEQHASLPGIGALPTDEPEALLRKKQTWPKCRELGAETSGVAATAFLASTPNNEASVDQMERHRGLRGNIARRLPFAVQSPFLS